MERERQSRIGFTAEHDDGHHHSELANAAMAYAEFGTQDAKPLKDDGTPENWPWEAKWWKPKDRARNLVRAGALAFAALDWIVRNEPSNMETAKRYRDLASQICASLKEEMYGKKQDGGDV